MNSCTLLCYDQSSCGKHAARTSWGFEDHYTQANYCIFMIVQRTEFWFEFWLMIWLLKGLRWMRYGSTGYNYYNFEILLCEKDHIQKKMWFFFFLIPGVGTQTTMCTYTNRWHKVFCWSRYSNVTLLPWLQLVYCTNITISYDDCYGQEHKHNGACSREKWVKALSGHLCI